MNPLRSVLKSLLLASLSALVTFPAQGFQALQESPLTTEINRALRSILEHEPLTTSDIEAAVILAQEAMRLKPGSADQARLLFKVAILADRQDLRDQALRTTLELDPQDASARLTRLMDAIDRFQTVPERIRAYEQLLSPANRTRMGSAIASRLALDLALLHERAGDLDGFAHWLAESGVIDPSNREAASLMAGFFFENQADDLGRAELLVNLIMADPTDLSAQVDLAQLLLNAGAYEAADRMYRLVHLGIETEGIWLDDEMLADFATVKWALGNTEEALGLIELRRRELDKEYRAQMAQEQPTLTLSEIEALNGPRNIVLSTVRAAILSFRLDESSEEAMRNVDEAFESSRSRLENEPDSDLPRARLYLEQAWLSIWLGADVERARQFLTQADALIPLTEQAQSRSEGWFALRENQIEKAVEALAPLVDSDPIARLGLALAYVEQNRLRDAARHLLGLAREQPGTLLGVWSAQRLTAMVGQEISYTQSATQLIELIESLPHALERYARQPTSALGFRLIPSQTKYKPLEPIYIDIVITNHASMPLSIDRTGPIRPQIAFFPLLRFAGREPDQQPEPFVVDIDRELRLLNGESHRIRIDLREYSVGDFLNDSPLTGASFTMTGIINFHAQMNGALETGLLGSTASISLLRIDGVRVTEEWLRTSIDSIRDDDEPDQRKLALLSHVVARPIPKSVFEEDTSLIDEARAAALAAYSRLQPDQQAWMLAVMPRSEVFEPLLNAARKSDQHLVKLAYLLFQVTGPDDPMLDAAMRGDDETTRIIAEMIRSNHALEDEANNGQPDTGDDGDR
ncbi:MAG: hypothetical protein O7G85_04505 [Planctomycetota bacterium]|nr:hypothetical protein [Planctomycetota bacterium]